MQWFILSGFVDVFADNKEAVVNHGHKLLKVKLKEFFDSIFSLWSRGVHLYNGFAKLTV